MEFEIKHPHPWDVSPREAIAIQKEMAALVRETPLPEPVQTVAGIDVSVREDRVQTAVVVIELPGLEVVDQAVWRGAVQFPYVPGLLSFREAPAIFPALEKLSVRPDVLMTDSQGLAHPRRFGLACHLGVLLDWPTVGVAKSLLVGRYADLDETKGSSAPLEHRKEVVGAALRTRDRTLPVYVSMGHRATLEDAVRLTLACTSRYKIPEPTRLAHHLSRADV